MATVTRTVTAFTNFSGRRKDGHAVKAVTPQFDGSFFAGSNCAAAAESTRDIAMNQGKAAPGSPWQPTGASIRAGTGDTSGGLMPSQTTAVSARHYDFNSDIRIVDWSVVLEKLWARYSATLMVRYGPIADAGHSGSPGFRGNHSIHLLGVRKWDSGKIEILVSDSLCDGRRDGIPEGTYWLDIHVLKRAASDLELANGVTLIERNGSNHAYVSFATIPYKPPVAPTQVVLKFGAHKIVPKRFKCLYNRTLVRTSPKRVATNHAAVIDRGDTFDGYQRVDNSYGAWIGNKAGTRWVFRPGLAIVRRLP